MKETITNDDSTEGEDISFEPKKNDGLRGNFTPFNRFNQNNVVSLDNFAQKYMEKKNVENLFEEFLIYGASKQDLIEAHSSENSFTLKPKILYSYPDSTDLIKK